MGWTHPSSLQWTEAWSLERSNPLLHQACIHQDRIEARTINSGRIHPCDLLRKGKVLSASKGWIRFALEENSTYSSRETSFYYNLLFMVRKYPIHVMEVIEELEALMRTSRVELTELLCVYTFMNVSQRNLKMNNLWAYKKKKKRERVWAWGCSYVQYLNLTSSLWTARRPAFIVSTCAVWLTELSASVLMIFILLETTNLRFLTVTFLIFGTSFALTLRLFLPVMWFKNSYISISTKKVIIPVNMMKWLHLYPYFWGRM